MTDRYIDAYVDQTEACNDCGSLVWNRFKHDQWHDRIDRLEAEQST